MPSEQFIADLHIHSRFSIATSKNLIPEYLDQWARIKGITVVGTGDCIHPGWLAELKEKLEPAGNGLYKLRNEFRLKNNFKNDNIPRDIFFILTGEISSIYKKNLKVRKVHNLCVFPDFEAVEKLQQGLKNFNISSDGRPIIGLDSKYLLEKVLSTSDKSFIIPAHIWTPWFSVLGSKSGFDTIKECYEELTRHIFAIETGLSSDPAMNNTCGFLNDFKLVSNSDAHSPEKLGREANIFNTDISYDGIYNALSGDTGFSGTIEFFPQEGKYHYDGHRKCGIIWDPIQTLKHNGICPVCGKPVTKGVMYRVAELADRSGQDDFSNKRNFYSITSLPDIIAELLNKINSSSKFVKEEYSRLIDKLGSEFHVLLFADINDINDKGGELLAEGIRRLRKGQVIIEEGYDGEFGRIKVFNKDEITSFTGSSFFSTKTANNNDAGQRVHNDHSSIKFNIDEFKLLKENSKNKNEIPPDKEKFSLNADQSKAINHYEGPCMVIAGPGSGKTRVLTERITSLISGRGINPENILAITFSNKAAGEIRERLLKKNISNINVSTFHSFGLSVLKKHFKFFERPEHFYITDNDEIAEIIDNILNEKSLKPGKIISEIGKFKQGITQDTDPSILNAYNTELKKRGAFDLDDLIYLPDELFSSNKKIIDQYRKQYQWILVDEFQDINEKQYNLMLQLCGKNPNLFAIGDPDQSIYGFRGSDVKYIEKLRHNYPDMKLISLHESYRCPDKVLRAAGQVLEKKEYLKGRNEDINIRIHEFKTDKSEGDWIAAQIEKMIGGVRTFSIDSGMSDGEADDSVGFSDFAVLCRTSLMFDALVKAFTDHGIAYQVIGTEAFYNKKPFSSLISNFRRIYYHLINNSSSPLHDLDAPRNMLKNKEEISNIFNYFMADSEIDEADRKRMLEVAHSFGNDYDKFFLDISSRQGIDEFDSKAEAVSLMTIHASKGLEFANVFIPGCEDNLIPFGLFSKKTGNELAEEERLFYVGITRTKQNLFLTYSNKRTIRGRLYDQAKSPFLNRLEKDLYSFEIRESKKNAPEDYQMSLFED